MKNPGFRPLNGMYLGIFVIDVDKIPREKDKEEKNLKDDKCSY